MTFQPLARPASRIVERLEQQIAARADYPLERAQTAAAWVRLCGGTAMEVTEAAIGAGFDTSCMAKTFQRNILEILRLAENFGVTHPLIRARYEYWAGQIRCRLRRWSSYVPLSADDSLALALDMATHFWRREQDPQTKERLREIRALIRIVRRSEYREHFLRILDLVCGVFAETA